MPDDRTDLVARLRSGEPCGDDRCRVMDARSGCICATAAARIEADGREIERLREALRLIVISPKLGHLSPEQHHERCVNIAGAAVGEQP